MNLIKSNNDTLTWYLLAIRFNLNVEIPDNIYLELHKQNLIYRTMDGTVQVAVPLFEDDPTSSVSNDDVDEFRSLFKGIRLKSMSTKQLVCELLTMFLRQYPQYNMSQIIESTRNYIANTDHRFVPNADNYIESVDKSGKTTSTLWFVLENDSTGIFDSRFREIE